MEKPCFDYCKINNNTGEFLDVNKINEIVHDRLKLKVYSFKEITITKENDDYKVDVKNNDYKIEIGKDGRCKCLVANKCVLGRVGRCTEKELNDAGFETIRKERK